MIRRLVKAAIAGLLSLLVVITLASVVIGWAANGQVAEDPADVSPAPVVIVPGARVFSNGVPSLVVRDRVEAAVALYDAGIVAHLLVSGDNSVDHYNEPVVMRDLAVELGVPASDITIDYAGFDTWDTCLRAHEQFGVTAAVFVTQRRYASRAAALCEAADIAATVLAIDPPPLRTTQRLRAGIREPLAKVKAVGDLLRKPSAHFGGPFVGLVGSEAMPDGGHPPDWNWETNAPANAG